MAKISITRLDFDGNIKLHEVPAFRGAVVEQIGRGKEWFHNHDNSTKDGFVHFRYPLVQYKCLHRRPAILLLEDAADELAPLLSAPNWQLTFTRGNKIAQLYQIKRKEIEVGVGTTLQSYQLQHWLALNQTNVQRYRAALGLIAQVEILQSSLIGHIIQFFKGINVSLEEQIELYITAINGIQQLPFKGIKMLAFNVTFKANVQLPNAIGLGRGVAKGFGILTRKR